MESKPKVLMTIDWYLPGFRAGGPISSCVNLVTHLSDRVDFYILTSDRDYQSDLPYPGVTLDTWTEGLHGEQVMYVEPSSVNRAFIRKIAQGQDFDQVYIHGLFSSKFSIAPLRALRGSGIPITVATRGMLRESALRIKRSKKQLYLRLAKAMGIYDNVTFHATDQQEREDVLKHIGAKSQVIIAPNLPKSLPTDFMRLELENKGLSLIYAGRIAPEKNLAYALEVLAEIKDLQISFDIYGAEYDREYAVQCRALADGLPSNIKVTWNDAVAPSKLPEILSRHHALFLPTRGENFGHIILETFMAGRPVVISDQTPWRSLASQQIGFDLSLDHKEGFVQAIRSLTGLSGPAYEEVCRQSFQKAKTYCHDPSILAASKVLFSLP